MYDVKENLNYLNNSFLIKWLFYFDFHELFMQNTSKTASTNCFPRFVCYTFTYLYGYKKNTSLIYQRKRYKNLINKIKLINNDTTKGKVEKL